MEQEAGKSPVAFLPVPEQLPLKNYSQKKRGIMTQQVKADSCSDEGSTVGRGCFIY